MKEIKAYKIDNNKIFEHKKDAEAAQKELDFDNSINTFVHQYFDELEFITREEVQDVIKAHKKELRDILNKQ